MLSNDVMHTCCFIGHRCINETNELREKIVTEVQNLIVTKNVDTFLFGSGSRFNSICLEIVSKLKDKYPHIKRVYVRAEFPTISDEYHTYLLKLYEDTYYPTKILGAGNAVYVERNYEMIINSDYCIIHYDEQIAPSARKSGTKIALDYAVKQGKKIIFI